MMTSQREQNSAVKQNIFDALIQPESSSKCYEVSATPKCK